MIPPQTKVFIIDKRHLAALFRGEGYIANLPNGAELVGCQPGLGESLGVLYYSPCFPAVPRGEQIPAVPAVFGRRV